jgi:hypothetical protein
MLFMIILLPLCCSRGDYTAAKTLTMSQLWASTALKES